MSISAGLLQSAGLVSKATAGWNERFNRTDQSVTGQTLRMIAAKPDAMLIAAVGGPAVLPEATLRDQSHSAQPRE